MHDSDVHDSINLPRLVAHLERAIQDADWPAQSWFRARATLQQVRHARRLLKHVERDNLDPTPPEARRYQHYATTLQHLEDYMRQIEQQLTPPVRRPTPVLPSIPPPAPKPSAPDPPPTEATLLPIERTPEPEPEPIPGPSRAVPAAPATSTLTATPTLLQNSRALHDHLSSQLAHMATQLRLNATHFADSLDKDKSVVTAMGEKLEGNLTFMQRERIRLRDLRGRSGGTTCLVILSVIVVLIAFLVMVFVIRFT